MYFIQIPIIYLCMFVQTVCLIKVCKTEIDYYLPFVNDKCWDNPSPDMRPADAIRLVFGFHAEEHEILVKDGYVLTLVRFYKKVTKKNPVILGHGTITNGFSFISSMKHSLGYMLADEGYDVWIMNFRGTRFSRKHTRFTVYDTEFWDFSFHEIGKLDLASGVDYVYYKTRTKALYVGMSMGTTALGIYSSEQSNEAKQKLIGAVLMAPAITFVNQNSTLPLADPRSSVIPYLTIPHITAVFYDGIFKELVRISTGSPSLMKVVFSALGSFDGNNPEQIDWGTAPIALTGAFDITTFKILIHYSQCINTGEFKYYDYGTQENLRIYKNVKPPFYPLHKIKIPIAILSSNRDILTPIAGARKLYDQLPIKCGFFEVNNNVFGHIQMLLGKDIDKGINPYVLDFLKIMATGTCEH